MGVKCHFKMTFYAQDTSEGKVGVQSRPGKSFSSIFKSNIKLRAPVHDRGGWE